MQKFTFLVLVAVVLLLNACKNDAKVGADGAAASTKAAPVVPPSMEFKNHTNKGGVKPKVGDYVYFDMHVTNGDRVIKSTLGGGGLAKVKFAEVSGEDASPSVAALKNMCVGDSTTILVKGDKYIEQIKKNWYPEASGDIKYQIIVRAIKTEQEYLADLEEDRKMMQKRLAGAIPRNNNSTIEQSPKSKQKK